MAKIQVDIISRSRASCTDEFVTNDTINAEELQHLLERRFGEGALWDSQRRPVISHPARIIEAGDYQYTISLNVATKFDQATCHDACSAIQQHNYHVLSGHTVAPMPLPPTGTSEWEPFRSWEYSEKSVARAALAEHHKLQLQRMGTEMGEDGNKVLDLGNMKDLLELTDGNDLWYKGTLDFAVVPYIVSQEDIDAKSDIRVGFVHLENRDYKVISSQLSGMHLTRSAHHSQGRSKEGSDASRLKKHHSQAIVTMYAVLSKSSAPLDLIVTDGMTFDLFRFREDRGVLVYHDLSGTEAYFALSEALKENWMSE